MTFAKEVDSGSVTLSGYIEYVVLVRQQTAVQGHRTARCAVRACGRGDVEVIHTDRVLCVIATSTLGGVR